MADYKGLTITFEGDSSSLSAALAKISRDASTAQGNLTGISGALRNSATNGNALNRQLGQLKVDNLGRAAEDARKRVDALTEGYPKAKEQLAEYSTQLEANKAKLQEWGSMSDHAKNATVDYDKAIDKNRRSVKELQGELSGLTAGTKEYRDTEDALLDAMVRGDDLMEARNNATRTARLEYSSLKGETNALEEKTRSLQNTVNKMPVDIAVATSEAQKLETQYRVVSGATNVLNSGFGTFGTTMIDGGNAVSNFGDKITALEGKMAAVAGISLMTFGRDVLNSVEEYGNSISQLGGYLDIEGQQLQHMSDLALYWGKETQFSAVEASNAMGELAKGGMTQVQIEGGAMQATMALAAAGGLDMATSAEVAVQAIKTFGLSAADSSSIADALAGAANKSTAEIMDLAQGFKYVGGWASMVNWDINDVSGALALLSDHGLRGEMAGTALRNVMQRLGAPTDKAASIMEEYGIQVRDSTGQMKSAVQIVDELNKAFENVGDEEKQNALNTIFGARALPAAIALMNEGSETLQEYINSTEQVGYAEEMAKNRMGDLGWALEYLRGEFETFTVNLGNVFAPVVEAVAGNIEGLLQTFNDMDEAGQRNAVSLAMQAAAIGPLLSVGGRVVSGLGKGAIAISAFAEGIGSISPAATGAEKVMSGLATSMVALGTDSEVAIAKAASMGTAFMGAAAGIAVLGGLLVAGGFIKHMWEVSENARLAAEAQANLSDSTNNLASAAAESNEQLIAESENLERVWMTADDVNKNANELAERNNKLADSINETRASSALNKQEMEQAGEVMRKYANQQNLSATAQWDLKDAVDRFNQAAGTSYQVVDAANGVIADQEGNALNTAEAIEQLVQENVKLAEAEGLRAATQASWQEYYVQQAKHQTTLTDIQTATDRLADAERKRGEIIKKYGLDENASHQQQLGTLSDKLGMDNEDVLALADLNTQYSELENNLDILKQKSADEEESLDGVRKSAEQLEDQYRKTGMAQADLGDDFISAINDKFVKQLGGGTRELAVMQDAISQSGISIEQFGTLTTGALTDMGEAVQNGAEGASVVLDTLAEHMDEIGDEGLKAAVGFASGLSDGATQALESANLLNVGVLGKLNETSGKTKASGSLLASMFADGIKDGSVSAEANADELAKYINDKLGELKPPKIPEADWNKLLEGSESIDDLISNIQLYNDTTVKGKDFNVNTASAEKALSDAKKKLGEVAQLPDIKKGISVESSQAESNLESTATKALTLNGIQLVDKVANAQINGNATDPKTSANVWNSANATNSLRGNTVSAQVNGNATYIAGSLWDTVNALANLAARSVISVAVDVAAKVVGGGKAKGGIRTHADGGIATRAIPLDIVGEAGAEAIVPLTNKRYAQPFVDMISEGIAGTLPRGGDTYIIGDLSYLPGSVVSRHVEAIFDEARRKVRM